MAFTPREFALGAFLAWVIYLAFTAGLWIWAGVLALLAVLFAIPASLTSLLLVGAPLSYALGHALRAVRRRRIHVLAHSGAAVVAALAGIVIHLSLFDGFVNLTAPHLPDLASLGSVWIFALLQGAVTIPAVLLGWELTMQRALSRDAAALTGAAPEAENERLETPQAR